MQLEPTAIPDVILVRPSVFRDARGFFLEAWHERRLSDAGLALDFVQDNHSRSRRNTLRGLHYQLVRPQGKLVRVATGAVYDVAVDLRRASPHFGKWVGAELTDENLHMLWVPPGFAHGFLVLSESADLIYKCTEYYAPEHDRSIRWDDADLGIEWPLPADAAPLLSAKDQRATAFRDAEVF